MRKKQINYWCSVGMDGVLVFQCVQLDFALLPALFSKLLAAIYLIKTIATLFLGHNLEEEFGKLLVAVMLSILCGAIYKAYNRWLKRRVEDKYEIDRIIAYSKAHLTKPDSRMMYALQVIEGLAIIIVALAPGVGVCYALYLITAGSCLAVTVLTLSILAIVLLCILTHFTCTIAWRRM